MWVVGGVADNGGWVPCGLGFSEQWNVGPCSSAYFVLNSSCKASRSYPCSESFVGNLVMIGNVGLHLQEKLSVSGCVSGVRLDPYRLKPVPVETPSGRLKISSV